MIECDHKSYSFNKLFIYYYNNGNFRYRLKNNLNRIKGYGFRINGWFRKQFKTTNMLHFLKKDT